MRDAAPTVAILAAGGVRTPDDLERIAGLGLAGAVVGRALLDGSLPLSVLGSGPVGALRS